MEAIQALAPLLTPAQPATSQVTQAATSFGDILTSLVAQTNGQQQNADQAMQQLHAGDEKNLESDKQELYNQNNCTVFCGACLERGNCRTKPMA